MKIKILSIITILILLTFVVFLQKSFSKTNPYDPNWIYLEEDLKISKNIYNIIGDKNLYLITKLITWKVGLIEASKTNLDKFLVKNDTIKFVGDFLNIAPYFTPFHDSIGGSIFYNNNVSNLIKQQYINIIYDFLEKNKQKLDFSESENGKKFINTFSIEFAKCGNKYPLSEKIWKIYWLLGNFEKMVAKNDIKTYCNFLYAGYGTDLEGWYENMIIATRGIPDVNNKEYILSFGKRLKEYYLNKAKKKYKINKTKDGYNIYDGGQLNKKIKGINKIVLNEINYNILSKIIGEK